MVYATNIGAIIMVNADLTANVENAIIRQLQITDTMDGYEFDARVVEDPNYPAIIHNSHLRILVIRSFRDFTNRHLMDVVMFIKSGLAYIEKNRCGPPGETFQVDRMQLEKVLMWACRDDRRWDDDDDFECCHNPLIPPCHICKPRKHIQSNVLYPLFHHFKHDLYPFGSDRPKFLEEKAHFYDGYCKDGYFYPRLIPIECEYGDGYVW